MQGNNRSLPVTARSLETLIRLASAHAKARLSHKVDEADAAKAVDLMSFALYHETASSLDEQQDENDEQALRSSAKQRYGKEGGGDVKDENDHKQVISTALISHQMTRHVILWQDYTLLYSRMTRLIQAHVLIRACL